jgi:hypothetical protein
MGARLVAGLANASRRDDRKGGNGMAFRRRKAPEVPPTNAEQAERHVKLAEHYLARSKKSGRIEYHTQLASTANTHATLALFYQQADPSKVIIQGEIDDDDVED